MAEFCFFIIIVTVLVLISYGFVSYKMIKDFVMKFPEEAKDALPYYGSFFVHQSSLFYIFRDDVKELMKSDGELWELRQLAVILLALFFLVPAAGITMLILQI